MSCQTPNKKKSSFQPIVVTSKSIRPVDRSHYQLTRNHRRLSSVASNSNNLTSIIFRQASRLQSTLAPQGRIIQCSLNRKSTSPAVVKMQFKQQSSKYIVQQHQDHVKDSSRYLYFTNAKTFQQFTKLNKVGGRSEQKTNEDWKKYLDTYYLNVRKVKPLLKRDFLFNICSPKKSSFSLYQKRQQQQIEKQNTVKQDIQDFNPLVKQQSFNLSLKKNQQRQNDSPDRWCINEQQQKQKRQTIIKIQNNIMKQKSCNRKQYFVFGMSQGLPKTEDQQKNKIQIYRDFIMKVNFANGLYVISRDDSQKMYKFYVGPGNNSSLIKGILRRRFWWTSVQSPSQANFVWTQLKINSFIQKQQTCDINFFKQINNKIKANKQQNKKQKDNDMNKQQFDAHVSIFGQQNDLQIWKDYYFKNWKTQKQGFDVKLTKRSKLFKYKKINIIDNNSLDLKVNNHVQFNYFIGNKKALFYSIYRYYTLINKNPFISIPVTFHISQGLADPQYQKFFQQYQKLAEKNKGDRTFRNVWIVKPGQLTNRGRGITVCGTLDEIKARLRAKQKNNNGSSRTFIVQKYIQKPLLFHGRKFDLRHYMAITTHNGRLRGYWYSQGYVRTSATQYSLSNTRDPLTHLTNDAIQKNGKDYGKYQKGNKLSYSQFQKYLNIIRPGIDLRRQILPRMKQIATDSLRSTYNLLDPKKRLHNFQLFGLDFMLDQSLSVYLIEVNTNPCLQTSCPNLTKVIAPLIQNLFKLTLDPLFPPPFDWPVSKKYLLGDNALLQNKFSLIFDEVQDGPQLHKLYSNIRFDERMGIVEQQDQEYQDDGKQWVQQQTKQ